MYSILLSLSPLLLAIGFGIGMGCVGRSVMIIMPFVIIRKFSGGYHTKHAWSCLIWSCLLLVLCMVLSFHIKCGWVLALITVGAVRSLICFSPIDNENRVLSQEECGCYKMIAVCACNNIYACRCVAFCVPVTYIFNMYFNWYYVVCRVLTSLHFQRIEKNVDELTK